MPRLVLGVLIVFLVGCGGASIPPLYTQEELKQECERRGGWWHADQLMGGFCEFQSPGFI